jgi:acyl carrier protein
VEAFLVRLAAAVLRLPPGRIDRRRPLTMLGLDSMMSVQLARQVELELDVALSARTLLNGGTIEELARDLTQNPVRSPIV